VRDALSFTPASTPGDKTEHPDDRDVQARHQARLPMGCVLDSLCVYVLSVCVCLVCVCLPVCLKCVCVRAAFLKLITTINNDDDDSLDHNQTIPNYLTSSSTHFPPPQGTHHSKFALLWYADGVRVVITTANFISIDWENKTEVRMCWLGMYGISCECVDGVP
jgi:hypothetical protein